MSWTAAQKKLAMMASREAGVDDDARRLILFQLPRSFPDGRPSTVIPHSIVPPRQRVHTTQKPVELMADLVRAVTPADGLVYDPCCGSGSTLIGALAAGRRAIGIDLDPRNVENTKRRIREAERAQPKRRQAPSVYSARRHASRGRVAA